MNNKLEEILADFDESFLMDFSYKTHDRLKKFLQEKIVEYARSKVPDKKTVPPEDSYDLGYNEATFDMVRSIAQDLQSLNK